MGNSSIPHKKGFYYDPRLKILQILLTTLLAFALGGEYTGVFLFAAVVVFALANRLYGIAAKFTAVYTLLFLVAQIVPLFFASMLHLFFLRIISISLSMVILYQTTDITELINALQNMRLPMCIVLPFAIILRFIPSLRQDITYIRQGMQTRGIGLTPRQLMFHPAQVYEGFLVPLLMRVLMTATELSASAETRGISFPCPKTHYRNIRFGAKDTVILFGMMAVYTAIIIYAFL